jgi:tryptophan synthase alpha subunit
MPVKRALSSSIDIPQDSCTPSPWRALPAPTSRARDSVGAYLERARTLVSNNPLLVGFGIRNADDARRLSQNTDGYIVGSALIREIERLWDDAGMDTQRRIEGIGRFIADLTAASEPSARRLHQA